MKIENCMENSIQKIVRFLNAHLFESQWSFLFFIVALFSFRCFFIWKKWREKKKKKKQQIAFKIICRIIRWTTYKKAARALEQWSIKKLAIKIACVMNLYTRPNNEYECIIIDVRSNTHRTQFNLFLFLFFPPKQRKIEIEKTKWTNRNVNGMNRHKKKMWNNE